MDSHQMLDASRRLSAALTPGDLDATLSRITAAAVEVLPEVAYASITVKHDDGRVETVAPTDQVIVGLDAAQYELREGPCFEAASDSVHVISSDLAEDTRFPRYAPVAVAAGIRGQVGIRLYDARASNGALNLYALKPGVFDDFDAVSELFAHQSAMALAYAKQVSDLKAAVESRQVIGQAVGIVMERYRLDDARAFGFLTRLSSHANIKLRVVAQRLVEETSKDAGD
ncbi:MAG TPA: GAF and ANTAR domain-containing protein [Marmoricola sp.]|nr:GAF and ANTAR domain-containing protein [Marmoricola sp.]